MADLEPKDGEAETAVAIQGHGKNDGAEREGSDEAPLSASASQAVDDAGGRRETTEEIERSDRVRGEVDGADVEAGPVHGLATIIDGWLYKKGVLGWKRRYFVVGEHIVASYADETCVKHQGSMRLSSKTAVVDAQTSREYSFRVDNAANGGQTLCLAAETAEEKATWMTQINEIVAALYRRRIARKRTARTVVRHESGELYTVEVCGTCFTLNRRFKVVKPIGQGGFGVVISAKDTLTSKKVAIKGVHFDPPRSPASRSSSIAAEQEERERVKQAKRYVREIRLLREMEHPCIVRMTDITLGPIGVNRFEWIYLVTEHVDANLHRVIYSRQQLSDQHIKYIVYQVLTAIKYLHSKGIVHRDLKPSNILLNASCSVKICDFGLSRILDAHAAHTSADAIMTEYVITRWYRAPEVALTSGHYTTAVDMWSVACIFAEMTRREPLFKGENYLDQLRRIFRVLGKPRPEDVSYVADERPRYFLESLPDCGAMDLHTVIPTLPVTRLPAYAWADARRWAAAHLPSSKGTSSVTDAGTEMTDPETADVFGISHERNSSTLSDTEAAALVQEQTAESSSAAPSGGQDNSSEAHNAHADADADDLLFKDARSQSGSTRSGSVSSGAGTGQLASSAPSASDQAGGSSSLLSPRTDAHPPPPPAQADKEPIAEVEPSESVSLDRSGNSGNAAASRTSKDQQAVQEDDNESDEEEDDDDDDDGMPPAVVRVGSDDRQDRAYEDESAAADDKTGVAIFRQSATAAGSGTDPDEERSSSQSCAFSSASSSAAVAVPVRQQHPLPVMGELDPIAIDLISCMLHVHPAKRLHVETALAHRYFDEFRDMQLEDVTSPPLDMADIEQATSKSELRALVRQEIGILRERQHRHLGRSDSRSMTTAVTGKPPTSRSPPIHMASGTRSMDVSQSSRDTHGRTKSQRSVRATSHGTAHSKSHSACTAESCSSLRSSNPDSPSASERSPAAAASQHIPQQEQQEQLPEDHNKFSSIGDERTLDRPDEDVAAQSANPTPAAPVRSSTPAGPRSLLHSASSGVETVDDADPV